VDGFFKDQRGKAPKSIMTSNFTEGKDLISEELIVVLFDASPDLLSP
jgi:hypothetical protein